MAERPQAQVELESPARRFGDDAPWLAVLLSIIAVEAFWWAVNWRSGIAPAPYLFTYIALAFLALGGALMLRFVIQPESGLPDWRSIVPATVLTGIGASLFLPLKCAIPQLLPFWADAPIAGMERAVLGADPWLILDRGLGWAAVPMDRLYGLWLPVQSIVLFFVMLQPGSTAKSRAIISYVLAWFLLGVVAATVFSSAGPIFYDRLFGGSDFAALGTMLTDRGAWIALSESDRMWASLASGQPTMVAGISAVPSIHVAISFWMYLTARLMTPRAARYALAYAILIWIGSVQLGWHYATDGLAGVIGMLAVWKLGSAAGTRLETFLARRDETAAVSA